MTYIKKNKDITNQELMKSCQAYSIDFDSLKKLIEAEKVKKLRKGNHLIKLTLLFLQTLLHFL